MRVPPFAEPSGFVARICTFDRFAEGGRVDRFDAIELARDLVRGVHGFSRYSVELTGVRVGRIRQAEPLSNPVRTSFVMLSDIMTDQLYTPGEVGQILVNILRSIIQ